MADPAAAALSWAIDAWRPGATVISVVDLHDGQGPWLIEINSDGTAHRAILDRRRRRRSAIRPRRFASDVPRRRHRGIAAPERGVGRPRTATGLIDWGCAGVGHPGIDLGHARLSATCSYGLEAAEILLDGWEQARGRRADSMPYWDTVAAVESAPDLGAVTEIRDAFLHQALAELQ